MRHHCWRLVAQGTIRYPKTRSPAPGTGAGALLAGVVTSHSLCSFGQASPSLNIPKALPSSPEVTPSLLQACSSGKQFHLEPLYFPVVSHYSAEEKVFSHESLSFYLEKTQGGVKFGSGESSRLRGPHFPFSQHRRAAWSLSCNVVPFLIPSGSMSSCHGSTVTKSLLV